MDASLSRGERLPETYAKYLDDFEEYDDLQANPLSLPSISSRSVPEQSRDYDDTRGTVYDHYETTTPSTSYDQNPYGPVAVGLIRGNNQGFVNTGSNVFSGNLEVQQPSMSSFYSGFMNYAPSSRGFGTGTETYLPEAPNLMEKLSYSAQEQLKLGKINRPCHAFLKFGDCHYGPRCQFSHDPNLISKGNMISHFDESQKSHFSTSQDTSKSREATFRQLEQRMLDIQRELKSLEDENRKPRSSVIVPKKPSFPDKPKAFFNSGRSAFNVGDDFVVHIGSRLHADNDNRVNSSNGYPSILNDNEPTSDYRSTSADFLSRSNQQESEDDSQATTFRDISPISGRHRKRFCETQNGNRRKRSVDDESLPETSRNSKQPLPSNMRRRIWKRSRQERTYEERNVCNVSDDSDESEIDKKMKSMVSVEYKNLVADDISDSDVESEIQRDERKKASAVRLYRPDHQTDLPMDGISDNSEIEGEMPHYQTPKKAYFISDSDDGLEADEISNDDDDNDDLGTMNASLTVDPAQLEDISDDELPVESVHAFSYSNNQPSSLRGRCSIPYVLKGCPVILEKLPPDIIKRLREQKIISETDDLITAMECQSKEGACVTKGGEKNEYLLGTEGCSLENKEASEEFPSELDSLAFEAKKLLKNKFL